MFRSVLGSDDDALRSDEPKATAFDLSGKWIVVAPVLKLAGDVGMSRVEVLYEDRLFGVVVVPPLVRFFLVEVREVGPCGPRLPGPCRAPVPDVAELRDWRRLRRGSGLDGTETCVCPLEILRLDEAFHEGLNSAHGEQVEVELLLVSSGANAGPRRVPKGEAWEVEYPRLVFLAVGPELARISGDADVSFWKRFLHD